MQYPVSLFPLTKLLCRNIVSLPLHRHFGNKRMLFALIFVRACVSAATIVWKFCTCETFSSEETLARILRWETCRAANPSTLDSQVQALLDSLSGPGACWAHAWPWIHNEISCLHTWHHQRYKYFSKILLSGALTTHHYAPLPEVGTRYFFHYSLSMVR